MRTLSLWESGLFTGKETKSDIGVCVHLTFVKNCISYMREMKDL